MDILHEFFLIPHKFPDVRQILPLDLLAVPIQGDDQGFGDQLVVFDVPLVLRFVQIEGTEDDPFLFEFPGKTFLDRLL